MSYKINTGRDYTEEYRRYSENVLAQSRETLKKAGINPPVFDKKNQQSNKTTEDSASNTPETVSNFSEDNIYSEVSLSKNKNLNDFRTSNGVLNTAYKSGIKANNTAGSNNDTTTSQSLNEFLSSMENADGKDDNDDIVDFMETEFKDGFHINGGGYTYYENGEKSSTNAVSANIMGSFKTNNNKFSLLYGGSFEYENTKQKSSQDTTDNATSIGANKDGNALLMAKYKDTKFTYAGGATAYVYSNNTELYNVYAGISHNDSNIAATLRRQIQVSRNNAGERVIDNKTSVKMNILKPKTAEDFPNVVPEIPTVKETSDLDNNVNTAKQNVNNLVSSDWQKGFSFDVDISTSSDSDEYGVIGKYATYATKKDSKQPYLSVKGFLGLYDYHPNSQEGIKVWTGAKGDLNITTDNNVNISSSAIVSNNRIMQGGASPINTYMTILDTTVSKNKWSASVSAGHINTNSQIKYSFITGGLEYKMKNSSLSFKAGYQNYEMTGDGESVVNDKDKIFHVGARYAINF